MFIIETTAAIADATGRKRISYSATAKTFSRTDAQWHADRFNSAGGRFPVRVLEVDAATWSRALAGELNGYEPFAG